jgi:hypothetical protein
MKINTRKLLLLLYPLPRDRGKVAVPRVGYSQLEQLWPHITPGGRRGLIAQLVRQGALAAQPGPGQVSFQLTEVGKKLAESEFGVLNSLSHPESAAKNWHLLAFLQATAYDPHFRLLNTHLKQMGAVRLNKGLYLLTDQPLPTFLALLQKRYATSTVVFAIHALPHGDWQVLLNKSLLLYDLQVGLSGISREVNRLIAGQIDKKYAIDQSKLRLISAYDRFYSVLNDNPLAISLLARFSLQVKEILELFQAHLVELTYQETI